MTDSAPSVFRLVDILTSRGLTPGDALAAAREIDETFGLSTRSRGSTEETREKSRLKKARQRERKRDREASVPGGQSDAAIIEVNTPNSVNLKKKESKSETTSPGDKPKRSKGDVLADDWKPNEDHYRHGEELKFTRQQVDGFAQRMRDWAIANVHRQVARKAGLRGWNAAFRNWLSSAAERRGGSNGASQGTDGGKVGFAGIGARLRQRLAAEADLPFEQPSDGPSPPHRY